MPHDFIRTACLAALSHVAGRPVPADTPDDTPLADLGIDSFEAVEAELAIEDALGIEIPDGFEPATLGDLIAAARAALGG